MTTIPRVNGNLSNENNLLTKRPENTVPTRENSLLTLAEGQSLFEVASVAKEEKKAASKTEPKTGTGQGTTTPTTVELSEFEKKSVNRCEATIKKIDTNIRDTKDPIHPLNLITLADVLKMKGKYSRGSDDSYTRALGILKKLVGDKADKDLTEFQNSNPLIKPEEAKRSFYLGGVSLAETYLALGMYEEARDTLKNLTKIRELKRDEYFTEINEIDLKLRVCSATADALKGIARKQKEKDKETILNNAKAALEEASKLSSKGMSEIEKAPAVEDTEKKEELEELKESFIRQQNVLLVSMAEVWLELKETEKVLSSIRGVAGLEGKEIAGLNEIQSKLPIDVWWDEVDRNDLIRRAIFVEADALKAQALATKDKTEFENVVKLLQGLQEANLIKPNTEDHIRYYVTLAEAQLGAGEDEPVRAALAQFAPEAKAKEPEFIPMGKFSAVKEQDKLDYLARANMILADGLKARARKNKYAENKKNDVAKDLAAAESILKNLLDKFSKDPKEPKDPHYVTASVSLAEVHLSLEETDKVLKDVQQIAGLSGEAVPSFEQLKASVQVVSGEAEQRDLLKRLVFAEVDALKDKALGGEREKFKNAVQLLVALKENYKEDFDKLIPPGSQDHIRYYVTLAEAQLGAGQGGEAVAAAKTLNSGRAGFIAQGVFKAIDNEVERLDYLFRANAVFADVLKGEAAKIGALTEISPENAAKIKTDLVGAASILGGAAEKEVVLDEQTISAIRDLNDLSIKYSAGKLVVLGISDDGINKLLANNNLRAADKDVIKEVFQKAKATGLINIFPNKTDKRFWIASVSLAEVYLSLGDVGVKTAKENEIAEVSKSFKDTLELLEGLAPQAKFAQIQKQISGLAGLSEGNKNDLIARFVFTKSDALKYFGKEQRDTIHYNQAADLLSDLLNAKIIPETNSYDYVRAVAGLAESYLGGTKFVEASRIFENFNYLKIADALELKDQKELEIYARFNFAWADAFKSRAMDQEKETRITMNQNALRILLALEEKIDEVEEKNENLRASEKTRATLNISEAEAYMGAEMPNSGLRILLGRRGDEQKKDRPIDHYRNYALDTPQIFQKKEYEDLYLRAVVAEAYSYINGGTYQLLEEVSESGKINGQKFRVTLLDDEIKIYKNNEWIDPDILIDDKERELVFGLVEQVQKKVKIAHQGLFKYPHALLDKLEPGEELAREEGYKKAEDILTTALAEKDVQVTTEYKAKFHDALGDLKALEQDYTPAIANYQQALEYLKAKTAERVVALDKNTVSAITVLADKNIKYSAGKLAVSSDLSENNLQKLLADNKIPAADKTAIKETLQEAQATQKKEQVPLQQGFVMIKLARNYAERRRTFLTKFLLSDRRHDFEVAKDVYGDLSIFILGNLKELEERAKDDPKIQEQYHQFELLRQLANSERQARTFLMNGEYRRAMQSFQELDKTLRNFSATGQLPQKFIAPFNYQIHYDLANAYQKCGENIAEIKELQLAQQVDTKYKWPTMQAANRLNQTSGNAFEGSTGNQSKYSYQIVKPGPSVTVKTPTGTRTIQGPGKKQTVSVTLNETQLIYKEVAQVSDHVSMMLKRTQVVQNDGTKKTKWVMVQASATYENAEGLVRVDGFVKDGKFVGAGIKVMDKGFWGNDKLDVYAELKAIEKEVSLKLGAIYRIRDGFLVEGWVDFRKSNGKGDIGLGGEINYDFGKFKGWDISTYIGGGFYFNSRSGYVYGGVVASKNQTSIGVGANASFPGGGVGVSLDVKHRFTPQTAIEAGIGGGSNGGSGYVNLIHDAYRLDVLGHKIYDAADYNVGFAFNKNSAGPAIKVGSTSQLEYNSPIDNRTLYFNLGITPDGEIDARLLYEVQNGQTNWGLGLNSKSILDAYYNTLVSEHVGLGFGTEQILRWRFFSRKSLCETNVSFGLTKFLKVERDPLIFDEFCKRAEFSIGLGFSSKGQPSPFSMYKNPNVGQGTWLADGSHYGFRNPPKDKPIEIRQAVVKLFNQGEKDFFNSIDEILGSLKDKGIEIYLDKKVRFEKKKDFDCLKNVLEEIEKFESQANIKRITSIRITRGSDYRVEDGQLVLGKLLIDADKVNDADVRSRIRKALEDGQKEVSLLTSERPFVTALGLKQKVEFGAGFSPWEALGPDLVKGTQELGYLIKKSPYHLEALKKIVIEKNTRKYVRQSGETLYVSEAMVKDLAVSGQTRNEAIKAIESKFYLFDLVDGYIEIAMSLQNPYGNNLALEFHRKDKGLYQITSTDLDMRDGAITSKDNISLKMELVENQGSSAQVKMTDELEKFIEANSKYSYNEGQLVLQGEMTFKERTQLLEACEKDTEAINQLFENSQPKIIISQGNQNVTLKLMRGPNGEYLLPQELEDISQKLGLITGPAGKKDFQQTHILRESKGPISKQSLSGIASDNNQLWNDLISAGYIDQEGKVLDKFWNLSDASEMVGLDDYSSNEKEMIFNVLQRTKTMSLAENTVYFGIIREFLAETFKERAIAHQGPLVHDAKTLTPPENTDTEPAAVDEPQPVDVAALIGQDATQAAARPQKMTAEELDSYLLGGQPAPTITELEETEEPEPVVSVVSVSIAANPVVARSAAPVAPVSAAPVPKPSTPEHRTIGQRVNSIVRVPVKIVAVPVRIVTSPFKKDDSKSEKKEEKARPKETISDIKPIPTPEKDDKKPEPVPAVQSKQPGKVKKLFGKINPF